MHELTFLGLSFYKRDRGLVEDGVVRDIIFRIQTPSDLELEPLGIFTLFET
jgi:hypothetical protein